MVIGDIRELLDAECLWDHDHLNTKVDGAFGCDLMSDCLAFVDERIVLLTGLTNPQVIRTAEMLDINAVVFVRGKIPPQEVIDMAKDMGIALLATKHTLYTSCGILYSNGLKGISIGGME